MFESINPIVILIIAVAFVLLAFNSGYLYRKKIGESKINSAEELSRKIIEDANNQAEALRRETLLEAKEEISQLRSENEEQFKQIKKISIKENLVC